MKILWIAVMCYEGLQGGVLCNSFVIYQNCYVVEMTKSGNAKQWY